METDYYNGEKRRVFRICHMTIMCVCVYVEIENNIELSRSSKSSKFFPNFSRSTAFSQFATSQKHQSVDKFPWSFHDTFPLFSPPNLHSIVIYANYHFRLILMSTLCALWKLRHWKILHCYRVFQWQSVRIWSTVFSFY